MLAIVLTYTAIVTSYVPYIIERARDGALQTASLFQVIRLLGFLYALPFLAGIENIIGILIIGFALYEAWS